MLHVTYLIILLPLVGFAVQLLAGRKLGDPLAGVVGTVFVAASFVVSIGVYLDLLTVSGAVRSYTQNLWTWIPVGQLNVHASLYVDPLSMTMVLFVTGVSTLIHLYSIGYMKGDRDYPKFFLYLNLFVASMLILVLGSNMLVTFVGWEGVGTCSYFLVSFWFTRESAASAGKKAFIYNRIGDVGFLLAIFLTFERVHSLEYTTIFARIGSIGAGNITAICLLLLVGVMGKSAQIPLFPWLADAMEGPTPVSALIHAATMVTAGVYLLCRVNPLLHASSAASLTVACVGAATAFVAATIACAQQDIKKVLAYSTVSQLGYMFLAIGCGAYEAAIFLMVAHAFFKALLFLGAGSAIHGLHDEQDLKRMGNLRAYMPITFITFAIGWLAIAAVPPLSGFWAKGDVLENTWAAHPGSVGGGCGHRRTDRLLHEPAHRTGLLRERPVVEQGADRRRHRPARLAPRRGDHPRAARVEAGDDRPSVDPGLLRRRGRRDGPVQQPRVAGQLGRPCLRGQPVQRPSGYRGGVGPGHHRRGDRRVRGGRRLEPLDVAGRTAGARNRLPGALVVHQRALRRGHRPTGRALGRLFGHGHRQPDHRRRRQRGSHRGAPFGIRSPPHPDRLCPQLRTGHRARYRARPGLHADPAVVELMNGSPFPYLTVLILVPAVGAAVVALVPNRLVPAWFYEAAGTAVAVATLAVAVASAVQFKVVDGGYQQVSNHVWAPSLGIHWSLGIDGISLFLVLMTALLFPLALLGARVRRDPRSFVAWVLLLEAACLGSFVALDLVLFFLFFELTLVPSYFIIGGWGYARRGYAAIKFFIYTFTGSAFLLVGILAVAFLHQSQTGVLTFELPALMHTHLSGTEGVLLFLAFTAAFAVKAPIFPFHTWSPDAYGEAPTAGAVLLAAVMAKIGTYGIVRFDLNLFPQATRTLAPWLLTLAAIGIVYGALVACAQRDLKRLLAYSSLAGIGFAVLGTFALNQQGITGGVLQMVNHGLIIAVLFIVVGWIYERRGTWQVTSLRGLQSVGTGDGRSVHGGHAGFGGRARAQRFRQRVPGPDRGVPGPPVVGGGRHRGHHPVRHLPPVGLPAGIPRSTPTRKTPPTRDLGWGERLIVAPLIILIVAIGVFPKPVLDRITPSVDQLVVHVDRATHTRLPAGLAGIELVRPATGTEPMSP